jgi:hypothetical protein
MITNELLQNHPFATEVVREWFIEKMQKSFVSSDVPEDFKEMMRKQGLPDEKLIKMFQNSPRVLFDVFDENGIRINIVYDYFKEMFKWGINSFTSEERYPSRIEAEHASVKVAFATLEDKLLCIRDTNKLNA